MMAMETKGERRAWRRFVRSARQCRRGRPKRLDAEPSPSLLDPYRTSHYGYDPAEWAAICDAEFRFLQDIRVLAYEASMGGAR